MEPHVILGVSPDADQDEIKSAFRREASKWHPDRVGDSQVAKDHFQAINAAYQKLRRRARGENRRDQANDASRRTETRETIDDVVWETLFEYAISLARTGMPHAEVEREIVDNGYESSIAVKLADAAFDYLDVHPTTTFSDFQRTKSQSFCSDGKIYDKYTQVFLGGDFPFTGNRRQRETINYYQDVFTELFYKDSEGQKFALSKNSYLFKTLLRALLLLAAALTIVFFLPGLGKWVPLGDLDLLQLPNIVLALTLVWAAHKKLWGVFLVSLVVLGLSQALFLARMPGALENGIWQTAKLSLIIFIPFLLLSLVVNSLYFQRAKKVIQTVCLNYDEDKERLLLINRKGGTSRAAAYATAIAISAYFLHVIPEHNPLDSEIAGILFPRQGTEISKEQIQADQKTSRSEQFFESGENQYHAQPPNYRGAALAYASSVQSGSLLATYKLAYMYLHGEGVPRDDAQALRYFQKATDSSLSSQPHKLSVTTHWLAESYAALGIMYLAGYGVERDSRHAEIMLNQATRFGISTDRRQFIKAAHRRGENLRNLVLVPDFRRDRR